jgi:hypothetical protein
MLPLPLQQGMGAAEGLVVDWIGNRPDAGAAFAAAALSSLLLMAWLPPTLPTRDGRAAAIGATRARTSCSVVARIGSCDEVTAVVGEVIAAVRVAVVGVVIAVLRGKSNLTNTWIVITRLCSQILAAGRHSRRRRRGTKR